MCTALLQLPTLDYLCRGSLRVDMPALWDPLILMSTAHLVRPLHSHENTLAPITLYPFGIEAHAQVKNHDDILATGILMLRLCSYFQHRYQVFVIGLL